MNLKTGTHRESGVGLFLGYVNQVKAWNTSSTKVNQQLCFFSLRTARSQQMPNFWLDRAPAIEA